MSDILVTYDDDSTELRGEHAPCIRVWDDEVLRHPSEERWYLWFPATSESPANWSFCAFTIANIAVCRGWRVWVWCETGVRADGKPLTGEWRRARVETVEEQLARVTSERDSARRIAVLDRKPLTKEEHVEMRFLVEQAKREGWL